jgi:hypothetical protein
MIYGDSETLSRTKGLSFAVQFTAKSSEFPRGNISEGLPAPALAGCEPAGAGFYS